MPHDPGQRDLPWWALWRTARGHWQALRGHEAELADDFRRENLRRLRYMAWVIVPLNLAHVAVFSRVDAGATDHAADWRLGVLAAHLAMATVMVLLGVLAHLLLTRWRSPAGERAVVLGGLVGALGFAGLLGVVDQWVTPSITPVLVGCLGVGLVFLIRAPLVLALYGAAGLAIAWGLGLTQHDPAVLLSNRVNTLTGAMMGAALALLLWHKSAANLLLQRELRATNLTLEQQRAELQRLAILDPLTGLINRREFERLARLELIRAGRTGLSSTLVAIDLDHFKRINDAFGHPVGDQLLQLVGQRLLGLLRTYDVLARFGGEEFMLLLPDTDQAAAGVVAEKLRRALLDEPFVCDGRHLAMSASLGVVTSLTSAARFEQLYELADLALYSAKQQGRNRAETAGSVA